MHQITVLSHADAMKIIETVRAELERDGKAAAVAVVDEHGELLAFLRTDGCPLPSIQIAMNKAFTAARQRMESRQVGEDARQGNYPVSNFGELRYVGWGGGAPIVHQGLVVGAVGVSGLPEQDDIEIVNRAVKVLG